MAFGDALGRADGGTVVLNADTGAFNARIEEAERNWRENVGQMSREALKLDLAQDRLRKSLASYGAESAQAKRATIGLKDAEEAAARSADRMGHELRENERHMGRLTRGALAGSGAFRGLGRSLAFASGSFLGGAGFIYAARQALNASSNLNEQTDFARRIFERAFPVVQRFANNALGLARDQALEAAAGVGALLKPLGVLPDAAAKTSIRLSKLAVDFASMRNAKLEDVLVAIRAGLVGESEPLRRFAVLLSEARVQQEALRQTGKESAEELTNGEKVLARVAIIFRDGAAAVGNYRDTLEGTANQERETQKNWRNTQILIGDTLRPAYTGLLKDVNEYLGSAENQRKIQRQVNEAVRVGGQVVRGFAGALATLRGVVKPVVDLLGGTEDAVKGLILALAVAKVVAFARAIRGIGVAAQTTRRELQLLSTTSFIPGFGVPIPGGGRGRGGGGLPRVGIGGTAALIALLFGPDIARLFQEQQQKGEQGVGRFFPDIDIIPGFSLRDLLGGNPPPETTRPPRAPRGARDARIGGVEAEQRALEEERRRNRSRDTRGRDRRTISDVELDMAREQARGGTGERFLRELRNLYARQARALEQRKRLSNEQKEKLRSLYGDLASVQSQLDAIEEDAERKEEERREKARERRRKAREKRREAIERDIRLRERAEEDFIRKEERAFRGRLPPGQAAMLPIRERIERQRARAGRDRAREAEEEKGLTEADIRRLHAEFLATWHGAGEQYGSNFQPDTWMQTRLLYEQNRLLAALTSSVQHPGAKYARTELSNAYGGVGGI